MKRALLIGVSGYESCTRSVVNPPWKELHIGNDIVTIRKTLIHRFVFPAEQIKELKAPRNTEKLVGDTR